MGIDIQRYKPPGPIGAAFIQSLGPINAIMGPGGSGKTVCSVIKGPMHAAQYMPVCKDGWVRVKTLCVRDTYRSFARTALASWYNMFPEKHPWTYSHEGGIDRPLVHTLRWEAWRGREKVNVEYTMETGGIGDNDLEAFAKGYEISMAWVNEYDLVPENTMPVFYQRCGRFPPVELIAPSELERVSRDGRISMREMGLSVDDNERVLPRIVWGDMNPPDVDHPAYTTPFGETSKRGNIVKNITPGWYGFWQPSGLSPNAENREGKPRSSYELEAATTKDKRLVQRMVHSLPAYAKDGTPVYEDYFDPDRHLADQAITPVPQFGLTIGIDGGGSPAATIGQVTASGQNRLLAELPSSPGTGARRFGQMLLALLMQRFPNIPIIGAWADPACWYGADTVTGEYHWINTLAGILGFPIMPAPSQEPAMRQDAVKHFLSLTIDNVTPGYIVDPSCKMIRGGFEAHYKFTKKTSSSETDKSEAVKNPHSHPHDAEQYRCLGILGVHALVAGSIDANRMQTVQTVLPSQRQSRAVDARSRPGDFNVWDV